MHASINYKLINKHLITNYAELIKQYDFNLIKLNLLIFVFIDKMDRRAGGCLKFSL